MRRVLALVLGLSLVIFAAGCGKKTSSGGGCTSADQCKPGETCFDSACRQVCSSDRDCGGTTPICEDSLCREGQRTDAPKVDRVDSDGPVDTNATHTGHYLGQRLIIYGSNLSGAGVDLVSGTTPTALEICASTPTQLTVLLPDDTTDGLYTLRVSTQATGSCDVPLQLLQGIAGNTGSQGLQGIPGVPCVGCVDTASMAVNAVTTAKIQDGTIASADIDAAQIQRRLTSSCTADQVVASVAEDGTVTCGGPFASRWTQVVYDDFPNAAPNWAVAPGGVIFSTCPTVGGSTIFGGNVTGGFSATTATKSLTGLPTHTDMRIVFDFFAIDSWDNVEPFVVAVDGMRIHQEMLNQDFGVSSLCGGTNNDYLERIDLTLRHSAATASIVLKVWNTEGTTNEGWGIDNFYVYVR